MLNTEDNSSLAFLMIMYTPLKCYVVCKPIDGDCTSTLRCGQSNRLTAAPIVQQAAAIMNGSAVINQYLPAAAESIIRNTFTYA